MEKIRDYFTKEYLAKLDRLSGSLFSPMGAVGYSGGRRSRSKGSSLEFSDFREYQAGDDLRRVDWNSYGRFDKLFLKLFLEEKQAAVHIFLDTSRSMAFDGKAELAGAIAASLAYLGAAAGDRTMLFPFSQGSVAEKRSFSQKGELSAVLDFLEGLEKAGETKYLQTVRQCGGLQRGISFLISDFMAEEMPWEAIRLLQEKKQQVCLLRILSPEEEHPDPWGTVRLTDSETGETRDMEITPREVAAYEEALRRQEAAMGEFCRSRGVGFCRMNSEATPLGALESLLRL